MVRLLGLTGPIACGKSTVSEQLAAGGLESESWIAFCGYTIYKRCKKLEHRQASEIFTHPFFKKIAGHHSWTVLFGSAPGWPVVDADKIAHELLADPEGFERR